MVCKMQADIDTKNMKKSIFLCDPVDSVRSGEPEITAAPEFPSSLYEFWQKIFSE